MIDKETRGLIALGCTPGFANYAAGQLLEGLKLKRELRNNGSLFYILVSCLKRQDRKGAQQFLIDWTDEWSKPVTSISRFVPGDHFHVLDTKFDSYREAAEYAAKQGYRVGATKMHYAPREGD